MNFEKTQRQTTPFQKENPPEYGGFSDFFRLLPDGYRTIPFLPGKFLSPGTFKTAQIIPVLQAQDNIS